MRLRIFRNAFLVGLAALILCIGLLSGYLFHYYETQIFAQLARETEYIAQGVNRAGADYFTQLSSGDRVTWVAEDGAVLYDSVADPAAMENHAGRAEISQALTQGSGQSVHFSNTVMEKTLNYAQRLDDGTVIRVSCDQNTVTAMLLKMALPILWIVVLVLALAAVLSYRLARQIIQPINAIDPDRPETASTYQELQPLIDRLQEQNRTIRSQMEELSLKRREFAAITDNMSEGFLLVDGKANILSGNRSALELLKPGSGEKVENLRREQCNPQICDGVERALAGAHTESLLEQDGRTYQMLANPVVEKWTVSGAVVILVDVTEQEQRESLRREFSANVSHELKTPLTSISGFAELMQSGMVPMEKVKEFSGDIYRESQRLIHLVDDIIKLSRLDENSGMPEQESVDLYELSGEILNQLRPVAEKQNITLSLAGEHQAVTGVKQILSEMIYNLCENAIKYNKENGRVEVKVKRLAGDIHLSVADTGVGIPPASQSRVFERFYRVDKSHSKEIGGTGLGLSIVKHGAMYHGARLQLDSTPGQGTTFTVIFPSC